MNLSKNLKKRAVQLLVAVLIVAMTATGSVFLMQDLIKPASAATAVTINSVAEWNSKVAAMASGNTYDVTLNANLTCSSKLAPIASGVVVNLNMNNKTIEWVIAKKGQGGNQIMGESYESGSYANGTYWGLITNEGDLNISGTGKINLRILSWNQNDGSKRDNYVQRAAAIVNGNGTLTVGAGITVESYLVLTNSGDNYKDAYLYNTAIYSENAGTVNFNGTINSGGQTSVKVVSGTNSRLYSHHYGIYGGRVNINGGSINTKSVAGALGSTWNCKEGTQTVATSIGVVSNNAVVLGKTNISTYATANMSTDANDTWSGSDCIAYSAGIMYIGANYPVIGPAVNIDCTFQYVPSGGGWIQIPGTEGVPGYGATEGYTFKNDDAPKNAARCAYPIVGVAAINNAIGLHRAESVWYQPADQLLFGNNSNLAPCPGTGSGEIIRNVFGYSSMKYYSEEVYRDYLVGVPKNGRETNAESCRVNEHGKHETEIRTAYFRNGAPAQSNRVQQGQDTIGTKGSQFLTVYRYYDGTKTADKLYKVSYTHDSQVVSNGAKFNDSNTGGNNVKGVIENIGGTTLTIDANTAVVYNPRYYTKSITYENVSATNFVGRKIVEEMPASELAKWNAAGTTVLPSGLSTFPDGNVTILYIDLVKKKPTSIRIEATNRGTDIQPYTQNTSFTAEYTGQPLVPGTDFNIGIIDMGAESEISVDNSNHYDNTIITNLYNIAGGSGARSLKYEYRPKTEAGGTDAPWTEGLPKNVGTYEIRATASADNEYSRLSAADGGSDNRNGATRILTCTITKANATTNAPANATGTYGDTLGSMIPFNSITVTGKGGEAVNGTWSYKNRDANAILGAGNYVIEIEWIPTPGSETANNYNPITRTVNLTVHPRALTVKAAPSTVGYGETSPNYDIEFTNLASCDLGKQAQWIANSTFEVYNNDAWVAYEAGLPMGEYPLKLVNFGGINDTNYTITVSPNASTLNVGKRSIHYTAQATDRVYAPGNRDVNVTLTYVSGAFGDTPYNTVTVLGTVAQATAGENKPVTLNTSAIDIGSNNYTLVIDNLNTLTVNITKATPTGVSCEANPATVVYDATRTLSAIPLSATSSAIAGTWSWKTPDTVPTVDVNSYIAVFTPTESNNYTTIEQAVTLVVTKKPVIVSVPVINITYGDPVPNITGRVEFTGFTGTDTFDTINPFGNPVAESSYTRGSGAGEYTITVSANIESTNYSFEARNSKIVVAKKDLTVRAANETINYYDAVPSFSTQEDLTFSGFYGSDNAQSLGGVGRITTSYVRGSDIGTYAIVPTGYTSNNYNIIYENGILTVNPVVLTVTPNAQTIEFGQSIPAYAADRLYTVTGYKGSDATIPDLISGTPVFDTTYNPGASVGDYLVSVNTMNLTATNYVFTGSEAVLTVIKADPVIDGVPGANIIHSQTLSEAQFDLEGVTVYNRYDNEEIVPGTFTFVNGDTVIAITDNFSTHTAVFTPTDTRNYNTVTVDVMLLVDKKPISGNPIIQGSPMVGQTLTLNLDVMDPSSASEYTIQWYAGTQIIPTATNSTTYTVTNADIGKAIKVVVTAKEGTAFGYTGSAESDPTANVIAELRLPSAEHLSFPALTNVVYDSQEHPVAVTPKAEFSGLMGNITVKYNGSVAAPKDAGRYVVTVDIGMPTGNTSEHFGPASGIVIGEFNITKATYNVTITADDRVYDGHDDATATVNVSGAFSGDDVALAEGYTFKFNSVNVGVDIPVVVSGLRLVGAQAANYQISVNNPTADITIRTLHARAIGVTKTYDGTAAVDVDFSNITGYAGTDSALNVSIINGNAIALSADAGTWNIQGITYELTGVKAANYQLVIDNETTAQVIITPAPAQVAAPVISGLVYDSAFTLSSIDLTPYTTAIGYWQFIDETEVPTVSKRLYDARFVSTSRNYANIDAQIQINVTPALVTLKADDKSISYGDPRPAFSITAIGFTGEDRIGDMGGSYTFACTYAPGQAVGTYSITINNALDDDNYSFTTQAGQLTVDKRTINATATAQNKTYDGSTNVNVNVTITGGIYGSDDVRLSASSFIGNAQSANAGTQVVSYLTPTLIGAKASNYELIITPATNVLTVEISKADVVGVVFPTDATIEFGKTLDNVVFAVPGLGDGSFAYENARTTTPPAAGIYENVYKVIFTPVDSRNYNSLEQFVTLEVVKCRVDFVVGIAGEFQEGKTIVASITGISDRLVNDYLNYKWYRKDKDNVITAIDGADTSAYKLTKEDVGCEIFVVVYFEDSDPYVFKDNANTTDVEAGVVGIVAQAEKKIQAIKISFWQRLVEWFRRLIAALSGLRFSTGG